MTTIASLTASATAYLVCGDELSASMCTRMIQDVRSMDEIFGEGAGDALHRSAASQLAIRAAEKLQELNERKAA